MWGALIYAGIMVGIYVYHRMTEEGPKPPDREVKLPKVEEGSVLPLIFGRCRVRSPVLAWIGEPTAMTGDSGDVTGVANGLIRYYANLFFVLGIPFEGGKNRIHSMYAGEKQLARLIAGESTAASPFLVAPSDLTGDGGFEHDVRRAGFTSFDSSAPGNPEDAPSTGGWVEFLNGNETQTLVDTTFPHNSTTTAGELMSGDVDPSDIPGYRGYMSVLLWGYHFQSGVFDGPTHGWHLGQTGQLQPYSFEVSSYPFDSLTIDRIDHDANPADVIYHLLKDHLGKLGLPYTMVDYTTFLACALTLDAERHGYSRVIDSTMEAGHVIDEILRQIDAVLYHDPTDNLIKMRLIRADYDVTTIPRLDPSNCESLENFAAGGWTSVVNKVRITFTNRQAGYVEGSATAHNQANAVGQDGQVRELVISMPGVTNQTLANTLAARELSARSRPIARCRATVDRAFIRAVEGDAIMVNWPEYNIGQMVFRVASVSRGAANTNTMVLELIQDFFYTYRKIVYGTDAVGAFPTEAEAEVE